ncbi:hypothetical protein M8542_43080 [Amycolatopsis sp. OK19-0408]|uniref:Lipoprotein n=1 Tax=Amycolatopsis iheyensis TaxID=2945988 RepID=A0A9X2NLA1_9PSEU|nr:hypothetical protein [Amycolatopsis iheyensis]MCR6489621.1 hypothetical protein [Amycolatopsis iheyensis]
MTRLARLAAVALVLAATLSACGDEPPARDAFVAKLKSDPRTEGTPDPAVQCIADWYVAYATEEERDAFLNGQVVPAAGGEQARAAMVDCLKSAAEPR